MDGLSDYCRVQTLTSGLQYSGSQDILFILFYALYQKRGMISDRQALLQRAKQRIYEKKMQQQELDDPTVPRVPFDVQPLPVPTPRYRRASLTPMDSAKVNPLISLPELSSIDESIEMKNMKAISTPMLKPILNKSKPELHIDTTRPQTPLSPSANRALLSSIGKYKTIGIPKTLEKMLEKGVTITPVDFYMGLAVGPPTPVVESEAERKRRAVMVKSTKRQPMPDESPIKEQEIDEINEVAELYSSNSALTQMVKWEKQPPCPVDMLFTYPVAYQTPEVTHSERSVFDGFYIGDNPIISYWNYDRMLRRLLKTEPQG